MARCGHDQIAKGHQGQRAADSRPDLNGPALHYRRRGLMGLLQVGRRRAIVADLYPRQIVRQRQLGLIQLHLARHKPLELRLPRGQLLGPGVV